MEDFMLPCITKKYFGFECLGCGIQRAAALLLKGEYLQAFNMYPAIYTLIPFFGFMLLQYIDKKRDYSKTIINLAIINVIIIISSFTYKVITQ